MPLKSSQNKARRVNVKELLVKANAATDVALKYHRFYRGKLEVGLKVPIRTVNDFAIWYTPGVAEPCRQIQAKKDLVFELTNRWNTIAIITDGTRVLGLGDIGPEASLPVMEGKAMLFKYLGGVDAFPICLGTKNPDEIIQAVKWLQPSVGGINLEDIAKPKCFYILEKLRKELEIPVWHDDQQGTALVTLAGLINALKVVGKKIDAISIAMIGAGAANTNIIKYLGVAGADMKKIVVVDKQGILNKERMKSQLDDPMKVFLSTVTNEEGRSGGIDDALRSADVCLAASTPGPGVLKKEWIQTMADGAIVFAMANPIPELWPWEAKEAGARIIATGRSDFPNQVNNSLGFPAVFRGALDVSAKAITDEMCLAAAYTIAEYAETKGISEEYILPTMGEREMYIKEAVAVGVKAMEQGVALKKMSRVELEDRCTHAITRAQDITTLLMRTKKIPRMS